MAHIKGRCQSSFKWPESRCGSNCTGLMACKLGGVEDKTVYSTRGQLCIVRNHFEGLFTISGFDDGPNEPIYIQLRMGGEQP